MSGLSWIGTFIYFLTVIALALLASVMTGSVRQSLKGREDLIKSVLIGILVISAAYWWATVPYAGRYDDSSDKLAYPTIGEEVTDPGKFLREHHLRIESLERELKEQREEFRQLQNHYGVVLQLAFFSVIFLSPILIFKKRGPSRDPSSDDLIKLNLHE